jgi:hypothetical protein
VRQRRWGHGSRVRGSEEGGVGGSGRRGGGGQGGALIERRAAARGQGGARRRRGAGSLGSVHPQTKMHPCVYIYIYIYIDTHTCYFSSRVKLYLVGNN